MEKRSSGKSQFIDRKIMVSCTASNLCIKMINFTQKQRETKDNYMDMLTLAMFTNSHSMLHDCIKLSFKDNNK